jgi:hypothetical protein
MTNFDVKKMGCGQGGIMNSNFSRGRSLEKNIFIHSQSFPLQIAYNMPLNGLTEWMPPSPSDSPR